MKVAAMTRLADNHATRSPRQCDDGRDGGEVVADYDRVAGLQGQIRSRTAHGGASVGGGQRGSVVDAVADHRDFRAAGLQLSHGGDLVVGQHPAAHVGDPYMDGEPVRGGLVVAGQHQRGGAGQLPSGGDRCGGFRAQLGSDAFTTKSLVSLMFQGILVVGPGTASRRGGSSATRGSRPRSAWSTGRVSGPAAPLRSTDRPHALP